MLAEIRTRVEALTERQAKLWADELCPALAAEGIVVGGDRATAPSEELDELAQRFEQEVYPVLTPLAVGPGQPFPYISALSLSLGVFVRDPETGEERLARVKVPEGLPRFVEVGTRGLFVPLEDVIAHFLDVALPADGDQRARRRSGSPATPTSRSPTRPTTCSRRSQLELRRRRFGDIVRVEVVDGDLAERCSSG